MLEIFEELLKDENFRILIEPWPDRGYFIFHVTYRGKHAGKAVYISMRELRDEPELCRDRLFDAMDEVQEGL